MCILPTLFAPFERFRWESDSDPGYTTAYWVIVFWWVALAGGAAVWYGAFRFAFG